MDEKLPEGWVETTLGDILPIQYGKGLPETSRDKDGKVPVYGSGGIVGYHNQALTSDETLILGRKGSVGSVYYSSVPCWPIDTTYFVERTASLNLIFFLHLLSSLQLVRLDQSTAIPGLSRDNYDDIIIRIPPSPEQNRIVAAIEQQFTRLDSAVASLQSAKARAKQYRASLLKAAVEGELTKEWRTEHPTEETGAQLLKRILAERRARWEEEQLAKMREKGITSKDDKWKQAYKEPRGPEVEELQELPEGWCWATMEQVIIFLRNGLAQKPEVLPPGYRILRINAVRPMNVDLDEVRYLPLSEDEVQGYVIDNGDVLFTRYNGSIDLLGVAGTVKGCAEPTLHPDKLIRVKTVLKGIFPSYIEIACNVGTSRAFIESRARTTAGQKGISGSDIKQMPIPLPPLIEQQQIVSEVEAKLSNIAQMEISIEANLKRAEQERQSILREAFAGRLVSQNPEDEPASVLLERIREERKKWEEAEKIARANRKEIQMEIAKRKRTGKVDLHTTLVEVGHPVPPDDLFRRAGLKADEQPESTEVFYDELDADVELALVAEIRPDYEHVLLEALEPSAEALARLAESQAQEAEQSEQTVDAPVLWEL